MVAVGAVVAGGSKVAAEVAATEEAVATEVAEAQVAAEVAQEMAAEIASDTLKEIPNEMVGNNVIEAMPHEIMRPDIGRAIESPLDKVKEFFSKESSYLRSMEDRINPFNGALSGVGEWIVEGKLAKFIPESEKAQEILKKFGLDGIMYDVFGEPDFSPISMETVEISEMSSIRKGPGKNFEQANTKCAEAWNAKAFEGKTDWTPRDVENWRKEHKYSWHERSDMKTMDLVPQEVHEACKHFGGCSECKVLEKRKGVVFDE